MKHTGRLALPLAAHMRHDWLVAAAVLIFLLSLAFAPVVFGQRHLMQSADIASVMNNGAYDLVPRPSASFLRSPDPVAPAWTIEPWFKLIARQYWVEFNLPLW